MLLLDECIDKAVSEGAKVIRKNSDNPQLVILGEYHIHSLNISDPLKFFETNPEICYCENVNSGEILDYEKAKSYRAIPEAPSIIGTFLSEFLESIHTHQNRGVAWIFMHKHLNESSNLEFIGTDLSPYDQSFLKEDIIHKSIHAVMQEEMAEEDRSDFEELLENATSYSLYQFVHDVIPGSIHYTDIRNMMESYNSYRENRMGETIKTTIEDKTALFPVGGFHIRDRSKIYDHLEDIPFISISMVEKLLNLGF